MRTTVDPELGKFLHDIQARGHDPGEALSAIFVEWTVFKAAEDLERQVRELAELLERATTGEQKE